MLRFQIFFFLTEDEWMADKTCELSLLINRGKKVRNSWGFEAL